MRMKAGQDARGQAMNCDLLCPIITGQAIHFIVASRRSLTVEASFVSLAELCGSEKNLPTSTDSLG